ncbi:hypothetical protein VNO80_13673 [Phaseolus coccineus]|uniref:Uncharacterized protein n=1 Tax=Phaseolus coccineus TaxID=3886 RepID=A0AAN9RA79_PHACN
MRMQSHFTPLDVLKVAMLPPHIVARTIALLTLHTTPTQAPNAPSHCSENVSPMLRALHRYTHQLSHIKTALPIPPPCTSASLALNNNTHLHPHCLKVLPPRRQSSM